MTWTTVVLHRATMPPPTVDKTLSHEKDQKWFPRSQWGINHAVLVGTPYERGIAYGKFTSELLDRQESDLNRLFGNMIPNSVAQSAFLVVLMRWFWGIEKYFEPWMVEEMYGVSQSAPARWNYRADPLTRQVAYHGLHEVGQFFADIGAEGFGCTVFADHTSHGWIIGRNFDFEGGRVFDEEKIIKWVYPDVGFHFASVIWAGMVGAVTGVNEHGVYVSINAAGTKEFARYGTPSTLVATKALQFSRTADEAKAIIEKSQVFIADIYVVADREKVYRIEKSPNRFRVISLNESAVVTNHFIDPAWKDDDVNKFRRDQLTSGARDARGAQIVKSWKDNGEAVRQVLAGLRDKKAPDGDSLHIGNRAAIDALIATHSVIYDAEHQVLYVSEGPAAVGKFRGYNLKETFATKSPVEVASLPADPEVTSDDFKALKSALEAATLAEKQVDKGHCTEAKTIFDGIIPFSHVQYFTTKGKVMACSGHPTEARAAFEAALKLKPAYASQIKKLKERLQ